MWKHRRALIHQGASGRFGRLGLLHLELFQVLLPLFAPLVDVFLLYGLVFLDPVRAVLLWSAVMLLQLLGGIYAFHLDGERKRALWLFPFQQIVYRQVMYAVLIQSIVTAFAGVRLRWQKLQRTGGLHTLLTPGAPDGTPRVDVEGGVPDLVTRVRLTSWPLRRGCSRRPAGRCAACPGPSP